MIIVHLYFSEIYLINTFRVDRSQIKYIFQLNKIEFRVYFFYNLQY